MPIPIVLGLCLIMSCGAFRAALISSRIRNGMAVGINEFSGEWEVMCKIIGCHTRFGFAGDFSGYDASLR